MSINITIPGGEKRRLLTGGKYCPEDILVEAGAGGVELPELENPAAESEIFLGRETIGEDGSIKTGTFTIDTELTAQDSLIAQIKSALVGKAAGGGITPTGTIEITENGTHDVTNYAFAEVSVPVGIFPSGTLNITENGTHNVRNYDNVNVNVAESGGGGSIDALVMRLNGTLTTYASDDVTSVAANGFYAASELESISLPNATVIYANGFTNCTSLKNVNLPRVTSLRNYAFQGCSAIEILDFPKLTGTQGAVFTNCKALTTLILRSNTRCSLGNTNCFSGTPIASGTGYIYVPAALVDSYKSASNWSAYASQILAIENFPDICG